MENKEKIYKELKGKEFQKKFKDVIDNNLQNGYAYSIQDECEFDDMYNNICKVRHIAREETKTKAELDDAIQRALFFEKWKELSFVVLDFAKEDIYLIGRDAMYYKEKKEDGDN